MINQNNSQMQFLQIVCIILVMTTLIGVVAAYMLYVDVGNLQTEVSEAKAQADRFKQQIFNLQEEATVLKNLTGYRFSSVGEEGAVETDSITGLVRSDIKKYTGEAELSLRAALVKLATDLQHVTEDRNTLQKQLDKLANPKSN